VTQTRLTDAREVLRQDLQRDPRFRRFWERTVPARAIANSLIAYRIKHNLTQLQLAERLGVKQPRIARLESGEQNPTWDTLWLLANRLEMSVFLGITPHWKAQGWPYLTWFSQHVSELVEDAAVEDVTSPSSGTRAFVAAKVLGEDASR